MPNEISPPNDGSSANREHDLDRVEGHLERPRQPEAGQQAVDLRLVEFAARRGIVQHRLDQIASGRDVHARPTPARCSAGVAATARSARRGPARGRPVPATGRRHRTAWRRGLRPRRPAPPGRRRSRGTSTPPACPHAAATDRTTSANSSPGVRCSGGTNTATTASTPSSAQTSAQRGIELVRRRVRRRRPRRGRPAGRRRRRRWRPAPRAPSSCRRRRPDHRRAAAA